MVDVSDLTTREQIVLYKAMETYREECDKSIFVDDDMDEMTRDINSALFWLAENISPKTARIVLTDASRQFTGTDSVLKANAALYKPEKQNEDKQRKTS